MDRRGKDQQDSSGNRNELNDIRPDHSLDTTQCGVERSKQAHRQDAFPDLQTGHHMNDESRTIDSDRDVPAAQHLKQRAG